MSPILLTASANILKILETAEAAAATILSNILRTVFFKFSNPCAAFGILFVKSPTIISIIEEIKSVKVSHKSIIVSTKNCHAPNITGTTSSTTKAAIIWNPSLMAFIISCTVIPTPIHSKNPSIIAKI